MKMYILKSHPSCSVLQLNVIMRRTLLTLHMFRERNTRQEKKMLSSNVSQFYFQKNEVTVTTCVYPQAKHPFLVVWGSSRT